MDDAFAWSCFKFAWTWGDGSGILERFFFLVLDGDGLGNGVVSMSGG